MPEQTHTYSVTVTWHGETDRRSSYSRDHVIAVDGKVDLAASSGMAKLANHQLHNPEDLLVASLSSCHMLWYLALCAKAGVVVTNYVDTASGEMAEARDGSGRFTSVVLRPVITLAAGSDEAVANALHHEAHEKCFVAQSVNFPVSVDATYRIA